MLRGCGLKSRIPGRVLAAYLRRSRLLCRLLL